MAISSNGLAGLKPGVIDNAAARPSSPFEGQLVYEKDIDMLAIWNGTEWGYIYSSAGNLLINGAMQVSQRSAVGTAVTGLTTTSYNTADRWKTEISSLGTWTQTTIADAPTGSGFRNSVKLACTTADASPAASDLLIFRQPIEGQNLQAIRKGTTSAQTVTLSFWVKSFQTGTFIVELQDADNTRACSKAYTVSVSNTWEYKTLIFPADVTGVFDNDNAQSLIVNFWLGAGSDYTSGTLATTWGTTTNANRAVGVTNLASSTSNTWFMTGAQLTVGSVATPFEFKSFADDLRACQRYYEKSYSYETAVGASSSAGRLDLVALGDASGFPIAVISFQVAKRSASQTITFYDASGSVGVWDLTRYTSATVTSVTMVQDNNSERTARIYTSVGTAAAREPCRYTGHFTVSAEL